MIRACPSPSLLLFFPLPASIRIRTIGTPLRVVVVVLLLLLFAPPPLPLSFSSAMDVRSTFTPPNLVQHEMQRADDRPVVIISQPILSAQEEQEKWLWEATTAVQAQAARLAALSACPPEEDHYEDVIRTMTLLLEELRNTFLAPQYYYELYVAMLDHARVFRDYVREQHERGGHALEEMYERVQFTGHVLPRLYLQICVGSVYCASGEAPTLEIVHDLLEMCKGVQHPTRGLFLRHFLLTMLKDQLPGDYGYRPPTKQPVDGGAACDAMGVEETVAESARLLVLNFREMIWLWIRMEAKNYARPTSQANALVGSTATTVPNPSLTARAGPSAVKLTTLRDRKELRVLVGMNVVRIAQLDGIDLDTHIETLLPDLLTTIVRYREPIAQQYLMDVMVQVFPDDVHLQALHLFIPAVAMLSPTVNTATIVLALLQRLRRYITAEREDRRARPADDAGGDAPLDEEAARNAFATIFAQLTPLKMHYGHEPLIERIVKKASSLPPPTPVLFAEYVEILAGLVAFTLAVDEPPRCYEHISTVLLHLVDRIEEAGGPIAPAAAAEVEKLTVYVFSQLQNLNDLLEISSAPRLLAKLPFKSRRAVAVALCEAAVQRPGRPHRVRTLDHAARLLELLDPLLAPQPDAPADKTDIYTYDPVVEFQDEQELVCRALHLLDAADPQLYLKMLTGIRKVLGQGTPAHMRCCFPTLAGLYLKAVARLQRAAAAEPGEAAEPTPSQSKARKSIGKCFGYLHSGDGKGILEAVALDDALAALHLYLSAASSADECGLGDTCYALLAEVFVHYDRVDAPAPRQLTAVVSLINHLAAVQHLPEESYELLATRACQLCSKMLRREDQSELIARCAHLFTRTTLSEENQARAKECVQRALKLAGHTGESQRLSLYVRLLNISLGLYKSAFLEPGLVNGIIDLIRETSDAQLKKPAEEQDEDESRAYQDNRLIYRNTTKYIRARQSVDPRWEELEV
ncbi:vacuolar sorting-associated-like protein [Strigomonas culicis]|uniref:Vacuolar protein sorting-associated protein 35 n=1 Tax=Strigomonas culicis TaxID=28005 RepID=S9U8R1_9TRYP|nr:vacuolar sorting-associated-like protein [Strigomonas culicis]|eukprot:EPY27102.1 vacuolar sorting-associated-like protein [Strigomonas culicis]